MLRTIFGSLTLTSDLVFRINVLPSIFLVLFEVGFPNLVCGCCLHLGKTVSRTILGSLTSDLVSRNCIESGAYLLYSLR